VEIKLEHEDWVHLEEAKHSGQLEDFLLRDRTRGFDLKQSPSMRLTLIHKQHSDSVVWSFHHILLDGWSGPILMQEVFTRFCGLYAVHPLAAAPEHRRNGTILARTAGEFSRGN
jgi:NRPS condensation-like uncharacterized protein